MNWSLNCVRLNEVELYLEYNGLQWSNESINEEKLRSFSENCQGIQITFLDAENGKLLLFSQKEDMEDSIKIYFERISSEQLPCAFFDKVSKTYDNFEVSSQVAQMTVCFMEDGKIDVEWQYEEDEIPGPYVVDPVLPITQPSFPTQPEPTTPGNDNLEKLKQENIELKNKNEELSFEISNYKINEDSLSKKIAELQEENERLKAVSGGNAANDEEIDRLKTLVTQLVPFISRYILSTKKFFDERRKYIMKNKKEDTKLYKGIIGLAKTAAGMNCEYGDYQDIKQYFRYPGELLERMEEQGFTSISDYISVMKGLSRIGKYHTDGTFIGSQLEDFLKRAKEKAVKVQNLIMVLQDLAFSYAHILRAYIADQKKLEEKAPILEEIFNQDVKEFLYQQVSYFTTDQIHLLFESGYLDFSEFMRINKKYSKEYLKKMDKPYLLTFLKTYCESRNWIFTDNEANFLENSFKDSWVIGLAYYKKQTVNYLSVFSEEEQEMLLGLMCELITRIPDICDLDDFMAGIISSTETRKILGAELSEQWYQFLEARSYKAMNSLRQDYLPEEVYAAFVQKKEKLEAEKKKIKEPEKLKEAKAALNDELNEISDTVEGNLYGHLYLGAIMV